MTIDAATALLRALRGAFATDPSFKIEEIESRSWASVTFTGARHELVFTLDGDDAHRNADTFLAGLDIADFLVRGHLIADIALVWEERYERLVRIKLEALTLEED